MLSQSHPININSGVTERGLLGISKDTFIALKKFHLRNSKGFKRSVERPKIKHVFLPINHSTIPSLLLPIGLDDALIIYSTRTKNDIGNSSNDTNSNSNKDYSNVNIMASCPALLQALLHSY